MAIKKHLIIGAGSAALSALEQIRRVTSEDEVKLVTMDDYPPYSPAALPYLLSGKITESKMWLREEGYFTDLRSTLVRGKEVTRVQPLQKKVIYRDGSADNYDTLLVASGAEPKKPPIQGLPAVECRDFKTLDDCRHLLRDLQNKPKIAVLGAGMVGMKIATALLERGCRVTVIEREQSILSSYFHEEAETYIRDIFTEHKAHFLTGKWVTSVKKKGEVIIIELCDGISLNADILINATGIKGKVSFLDGTNVKTNNGILVDSRMKTGVDDIYAAGDVAEAPDFFTGKQNLNATILKAVMQGKVAGANMAGQSDEYKGAIPVAAVNFFGNLAFSIGSVAPDDNPGQVLKQKDDRKRKFKKLFFNGSCLTGGIFLNEKVDPGMLLYLIANRVDLASHKEALFEGTKPLSDPWLKDLRFYGQ